MSIICVHHVLHFDLLYQSAGTIQTYNKTKAESNDHLLILSEASSSLLTPIYYNTFVTIRRRRKAERSDAVRH